jgi:hypothetical protein
MRCLGLCAILAWCAFCIPASAGERFGQWSLEQHGDFVFALSFKRSLSFGDRTATSELAFVCNQEERYLEPRRKGHNTGPREGRSSHQIDDTG